MSRLSRASRLLPLYLCVSALFALGTAGVVPAASTMSVRPPSRGAYVGAYPTLGTVLPQVTRRHIESFQNRTGHRLAFVVFESPWDVGFPVEAARTVASTGAVPLIQWEPWGRPYADNSGPGRYSLTRINAGEFDRYIAAWADGAKAFGKPLMVVFADEMNGDWFPWSARFNGGRAAPQKFVAAWRRVVDITRRRGATNITWVWQPNAESAPQADWNAPDRYYPGAQHVHWLGASLFGRQSAGEEWRGFAQLMDPLYRRLAGLDPAGVKPWMLVEWGVTEDPRKPHWIADGLRLMPTRYPRIRGAGWWDDHFEDDEGSRVDLRVDSSRAAQQAYWRGVRYPQWVDRPAR